MEKASQIFGLMKSKSCENTVIKIKPDLITFSTLIKGHCRVKNIQAALTLHETMLA